MPVSRSAKKKTCNKAIKPKEDDDEIISKPAQASDQHYDQIELDNTFEVQQQGGREQSLQHPGYEAQICEMAEKIRKLQLELEKEKSKHFSDVEGAAATANNNENTVTVKMNEDPSIKEQVSDDSLTKVLQKLNNTLAQRESVHISKLIDLPEFKGEPETWPMFIETFDMTTEEYKYNDRQNLLRLQKALKGKAKEVVECLLIHSSNVGKIIEVLKDRFGNPEALVKSQVARIRAFPSIPENRIEQLVPFATKVQNLASFLSAAKCDRHLANPILMEELVQKLPTQRRLDWAKYAINIEPYATIVDLGKWLQSLARVIGLMCINSEKDKNELDKNKGRNRLFHANNKENGNREGQGSKANDQKYKCATCDESHGLEACPKFKDMAVKQRWRIVRQGKLCFSCLKRGHRNAECKDRQQSQPLGSGVMVHKLLHETTDNADQPKDTNTATAHIYTNIAAKRQSGKLLFKILPVRLYADGIAVTCYAFFDDGSSVSLINKDLAERLGLKGQKKSLTLQWFGNNTVTESSSCHNLKISGIKTNSKIFDIKGVSTVNDLSLPAQTINLKDLHMKYRHMRKLPLHECNGEVPQLLIGIDNAHLGAACKTIGGGWKGPVAVLTKLGWMIYGKMNHADSEIKGQLYLTREIENDRLETLLRDYIVNENIGVRETKHVESENITRARKILAKTTKRIGTRFETGLLWKDESTKLPSSKEMALKRLISLERKFDKNEHFKKEYTNKIDEYLAKHYARKLSQEELQTTNWREWYLPHFGIYNPNKPGKLRLVFDAAAEAYGVSLNSVLLAGPDESKPLVAILMQFRQRRIGVCADVVEMFHQVKIRLEDQPAQRFLWRKSKNDPVEEYVMTSMIFGSTCSPCSAQYIKNKNAQENEKIYPTAASIIIENHYVDDMVHAFDSEENAIDTTKQVAWIHKQGGFSLKRFVSNSPLVNAELNKDEKCTELLSLDKGNDSNFQKVLGMFWDTTADCFKFVLAFGRVNKDLFEDVRPPTKREVLSIAMSVFDPFGAVADYSIMAKLILQSICRQQLTWDEPVPDEIYKAWKKWKQNLDDIKCIKIPRWYGNGFQNNPVELHIFSDASELAYAAVAYWRIENTDIAEIAFICGKSKCAPLKTTSIPRLELLSAVLGVRLREMIIQHHKCEISRVVMWSDSTTVLSWIRSDHRTYNSYVAHRVDEILEKSRMCEWRWVPTAMNTADFGTRIPNCNIESLWRDGPKFLRHKEDCWPKDKRTEKTSEEIRKRAFVLHAFTRENDIFMAYENFNRLQRVVAWILRYRNNGIKKNTKIRGYLKVKELDKATRSLCRLAQAFKFKDEIESLKSKGVVNKSSGLYKLTPILDADGLIRVGGRIENALMVPFDTRSPIILPKNHILSTLIIQHFHRLCRHQNKETIIAEIRRKYWIPNIRQLVGRQQRNCQECKNRNAKPNEPIMGQLPEDRLSPYLRAFSYTGIDFMGPFVIVIGRRTEKRWICLFTCLTTRAIHLEIAKDLSTDTCLMCIRNFINRRGTPVRIRSDNGTNFVGAAKELRNQWDNQRIGEALANRRIEWVFNSPLNPHVGGCWERLVRSVKRAMGHVLQKQPLQEHALYSLMIEAENIVNSRPLTHIPVDAPNEEPLTPNHFLLGSANTTQTSHPEEEMSIVTRKHWRRVQQLQNSFWKKWVSEYLPDLCRRTKWYQPVTPLKEDDIVLVCDSNIHRVNWPMGIISRTFPGKDNQVRVVEVRTKDGLLRRPACMIAKLDVRESSG